MGHLCVELEAACLAAQIILESGGETYRAEETAERMCIGLGVLHTDVMAFPTGLMLTVRTAQGDSESRIVRVRSRSINLARIDACNQISRKVAQKQMNAEDALAGLNELRTKYSTQQLFLIPAFALSAAFFSVMLGGAWQDFVVALVCGALTQSMMPFLQRRAVPGMLSGMLASFLTALIALIAAMLFPQVHPEAVISGAIMPLLPGIAMTNAVRDTMRGDLISGGARIIEAALISIMLAAGVGIMLAVWGGMTL